MKKVTVLVVDSECELRAALRLCLEREGFVIFDAGNSADAMAVMRDEHPDILLMEISFPGMDGIDLVEKVKLAWGIPIIALMARPEMEIMRRASEAGADAIFLKPCSMNPIISTMKRMLPQEKEGKGQQN